MSAAWDDAVDVDFLLFGSKTCPLCGRTHPANTEHYHRDRSEDDGLKRICVRCSSKRDATTYERRKARA